MKKEVVVWIALILLVSTILVACGAEPSSSEHDGSAEDLPPVAVVKARAALATELNVGIDTISIESYERQEWSDSCLGLGGPAESCLAAIHPGWQVLLLVVEGETYEVRTDELGEIIRIKKLNILSCCIANPSIPRSRNALVFLPYVFDP